VRSSLSGFVLISIWLCSLAAAVVSAAAEAQTSPSGTNEFVDLEKIWNEAHLKGDASALENLWSDDLQVIVPKMARMTKSDVLGFARSGRMKFDHYTTSNINVRLFGDTAVVTGDMKRSRTLNGQAVDDNWQFTKVYVRKAGRWRVVIFQASEAPVT
jgi:ketosteroid isomerase-like protein